MTTDLPPSAARNPRRLPPRQRALLLELATPGAFLTRTFTNAYDKCAFYKPHVSKSVPTSTALALIEKGLVAEVARNLHTRRYLFTPAGLEALRAETDD